MTDSYTRILAPLDGSSVAVQALDHAVAIALRSGAQLTLVQIVPDIATVATEPLKPPAGASTFEKSDLSFDLAAMQAGWTADARASLQQTADRLSDLGVKVTTAVLQGIPAESILAFAKAEGIDLIVMSTHGRGGIARLIYGSVATQVLRAAPCPVLMVRAKLDGA